MSEFSVPLQIYRMTGDPSGCSGAAWVVQNVLSKVFWRSITRELSKRKNLFPVLIVSSVPDAEDYSRAIGLDADVAIVIHQDFYAHVVNGSLPEISDTLSALSERNLETEIARREKLHQISVWRDIVICDRHLGRPFATGAGGFPTSRISSRATERSSREACLISFLFWESLAERFPPRIALSYLGGAGLFGKPMAAVVRAINGKYRNISYSRFEDRFYWADSEFAYSRRFARHFASTPVAQTADISRVQGTVGPQQLSPKDFRIRIRPVRSWYRIAMEAAVRIAKYWYGWLRGYAKSTRGYYLTSMLLLAPRARLQHGLLNRLCTTDLRDVRDRHVVYFALQSEPEITTYHYAPYWSDQLHIIREISLSLPTNCVLAVKEHPYQIGKRDSAYYTTIAALPNVIFVHPDYPGIDLIRQAKVIVSTSGSSTYQGAALGKYVFHGQPHTLLENLPHAFALNSTAAFDQIAEKACDEDAGRQIQREQDGARFYLALERFGFAMGEGGLTSRSAELSESDIEAVLADLDASLDGDATQEKTRSPQYLPDRWSRFERSC